MNFKDKRILITGSNGFIGSNLKAKLVNLGAIVTSFDLSDGQDIMDTSLLENIIKKKFNIIFHLAGFSGSKESNEDRFKSFQINTLATVNLMELITKICPDTKIILSSSRLEYGRPLYIPVDEKHKTEPTSAYGLSKLTATEMAQVFGKTRNLKYIVFRTSNVYGPHKEKKFSGYNLINHFIDLAKREKNLLIFGKGDQLRDYIYIDDLVQAFIIAAESDVQQQIYNLGYGEGISLTKMANLITKNVKKGNIKYINWPKDNKSIETGSYTSDISKIKKELGFKPKIGFEEGIQKTLKLEI